MVYEDILSIAWLLYLFSTIAAYYFLEELLHKIRKKPKHYILQKNANELLFWAFLPLFNTFYVLCKLYSIFVLNQSAKSKKQNYV